MHCRNPFPPSHRTLILLWCGSICFGFSTAYFCRNLIRAYCNCFLTSTAAFHELLFITFIPCLLLFIFVKLSNTFFIHSLFLIRSFILGFFIESAILLFGTTAWIAFFAYSFSTLVSDIIFLSFYFESQNTQLHRIPSIAKYLSAIFLIVCADFFFVSFSFRL